MIVYLLVILLVLLGYLLIESILHKSTLKKIPIRVHVNGTRGKSSVARLIAAGMRSSGVRTCAKTTGTMARMIYPDGKEEPVYRVGFTNIIEQVKVMRWAVKNKADAIVIECMALQPLLQALCEIKIVKSTHGVLTNARPDHLDVMGPTEKDVAKALAATVTIKGKYFTAEKEYLDFFKYAAKDRKTEIYPIGSNDIESLSDEDMQKFSYTEFKENVALALKVCHSLGLDRNKALEGMWAAIPDPGALREYVFIYKEKELNFANAFAANDPVSTQMLWKNLLAKYTNCKSKVLVVNCRADRQDRSNQIAEAIAEWDQPDVILLIGTGTEVFTHYFNKYATKKQLQAITILVCEGKTVEEILDELLAIRDLAPFLMVGVGNIAGIGMEMVDYCEDKIGEC